MTIGARSVAADVLVRVWKDGAFASAALEAAITRAVQLDPRDRALATEIVYGALRVEPWLLARLGRHAKQPVEKLPPKALAHLVVATYQLFFLSRVPAFAAVSEAVTGVREGAGAQVAAFANAILRKLAREAESERPVDRALAAFESVPGWLRAALVASVGEEAARSVAAGTNEEGAPPIGIRVHTASERDSWIAKLREAGPAGASFEAGRVSPLAIQARGASRPQDLPGWSEGAWALQEEGSQAVALELSAAPGEIVLDACAGRGNKTSLLARVVGPSGAVDAADLHTSKLERLKKELAREGLAPRTTFAVDWSVGSGGIADGAYDAVLVDAPCSGVGTMRRRPDMVRRRTEGDLVVLSALQRDTLARAARAVRSGGRVVYAVCSVLRAEAEEVVAHVVGADGSLEILAEKRLLPHVHGTDGYFLATLKKR